MDEISVETRYCWHCRRELTEKNSWQPTDGFDHGAPTFYCVSCQDIYYQALAKDVGSDLAYFYCCVKFDVPYVPEALKSAYKYVREYGHWGAYIVSLRSAKWHTKNGRWAGFHDGTVDIKKAFTKLRDIGAESPDELLERKERDWAGNIDFWGKTSGPNGDKYTEADYEALNQVFDAMTEGRSGISQQSVMAIKDIAKWTLERDKLMAAKEFDDAKKVDGMIEKLKESEQLRKKDELPQDRARLDDIVRAVERAGLNMMNYNELCRQLGTYMFHSPYGYTRDAADQMLLMIRNATAFNENEPEIDRLPDEFAIVDTLGEFAPSMDDTEKENYKDLGITPLHMKGDKQDGK